MGNTIRVDIPVTSTEQAEIFMAQLSDLDFHAFEQGENILSGYIMEEFYNDRVEASLSNTNPGFITRQIKEVNWNQKWESEFQPVVVDSFVAVRASFHPPIISVKYEIVITPKMSFGTGHHATTYLMLQQLQKIDFENKSVLDFGTGTGVLAILAAKAGAARITAIDNDNWSIENATENCMVNRCDNIQVLKRDSVSALGTFDIILANINLNFILQNMHDIRQASLDTGKLLVSGLLASDKEAILKAGSANGFSHIETVEKEGWICCAFDY